jgi:hypothetical protein
MRRLGLLLPIVLPLLDLAWNLAHLNIGLSDFYGLTLPALGLVQSGAWPATPYFPAGYPLLLIPFGLAGSTLIGGYILSAVGMMLALAGVKRIAVELCEREDIAVLCVSLAWLMASYRIVAGAPSVDALFTGIGIWFLWASLSIWREPAGNQRVIAILCAGSAVLPLLRYHAVVLILPVLLVLLVLRKRTVAWALAALVVAVAFNYASWALAYGSWMPSVVGVQIRNGIEADYRIKYPTPEKMYADYNAYVSEARRSSVIEEYGLKTVLKHTLDGYYHFVRRPTLAFGILLALAALSFRKRTPQGVGILLLWALGYCLALSPAYYTPRGALLPELVMLPVCVSLLLVWTRYTWWVLSVFVMLMLAAQWRAGRFARAMWQENMHFARVSREFDAYLEQQTYDHKDVVVSDSRVLWLPFSNGDPNPWCLPHPRTEQFWTEDPAIDRRQVPNAPIVPLASLAKSQGEYHKALMSATPPRDADLRTLESGAWKEVARFQDQVLFTDLNHSP